MADWTAGLIGREAELGMLGRFLDAMGQGPAGFLLEGPGGIGKSTLWQAALGAAHARGFRVLAARPSGSEATWAYQSLADLVGGIEPEILAAMPGPQRQALAVVSLQAEPPSRAQPEAEDAHARAIAAGTATALTALSGRSPVLLAIDDAPWLDGASQQVLTAVARRLGRRAIGILVTQRTEAPGPVPLGLEDAIPMERAWLEPMSPGALHLLLVQRLRLALPRPTLARVHEMAHGNPLHAVEIGRALQRLPTLPRAGEPLPLSDSLRALLEARLATVSAQTRDVLLVVAAAGALTTDELGMAAGATPGRVDASLEEAVDAGLIVIEDGVVRFAHPSFAATAYETASPEARRGAHATLTRVVAVTEARARHLALSITRPDALVAARLEAAAIDARRRAAMETGAELIRLAVERTPAADVLDRQRRQATQAELLLELPDLPAARHVLDALIPGLPSGPARAEAQILASTVDWYTETDSHAAVERLLRALPDAADHPELLGRIHYRLAVFTDFDARAASGHAAAAVAALRDTSASMSLAGALATHFHLIVITGGPPPLAMLDEALALEGDGTHVDMSTIPGIWWLAVDRPDLARARFEVMLERSRAAGETSGEADLLTRLAEAAIVDDRFEDAVRLADEAMTAAQQEGQPVPDPALRIRALAEVHLGRLDEATAMATAGAARARAAGSTMLEAAYCQVLLAAAVAAGRHEDVETHGARSGELLDGAGWVQPLRLDVRHERVEALVALGRLDEAETQLHRFERGARTVPRPWADAALARGRARLLAARGDIEAAVTATEAATDRRAHAWSRFDLARTLLVRGEVLRQQRARREAGATLDAAIEQFEALGASVWAARARTAADRLGRRRSRSDTLTATERRVAALAGGGLRNREVALHLGISPKTVEAHLASAYGKLGIRSRAELGRVIGAVESDSGDPDRAVGR